MGVNYKVIYGNMLAGLSLIAGKGFAKEFDSRLRFKRKLDLKNPKTLADKVSYLNLFEESNLMIQCTDKYAVREYIKEKGLEHILVPLVGGPWINVEDVDFRQLPDQFAIKATHGCKMNYIVSDKRLLDENECKCEMQRWIDTTYGAYSMELHYTKIPHRIYAEKFLGAEDLVDYKFHCLNGEPQFVLVCSERKAKGDEKMFVTLDLLDMEWKLIDELVGSDHKTLAKGKSVKPSCFEEMKEVARKLSKDFKFVRVDLYERNGQVYFGELTFSPACGVFPSFTDDFIEEMGKKLKI